MKSITTSVGCVCLFAAMANAAANRLEFYFSTQGDLSAIPAEYTAKINPTIGIGQKAYLWAYVQGSTTRWTEVSFKFDGPTCTGGLMYDPATYDPDDPTVCWWRRWNVGGDKNPIGDNFVNMVGVPIECESGLGKNFTPGNPPDGDYLTVGAPDNPGTTRHFLIGEMQFSATGSVFIKVGSGFILKSGGANPPTDDIYFGFSEPAPGSKEHILKAGGQLAYGTDVGASTATADLYIIPEPAGLLMLMLGAMMPCGRR